MPKVRKHKFVNAVDKEKLHTIDEAVSIVKHNSTAKFDESIDLAARLGLNPRQADQNIRGTIPLPHGTGKEVRVIVFAEGEAAQAARDAGADHVGNEDLVERITGGWLDFDTAIAHPDLVRSIMPKLGRILGPRGLMPNAKAGTVTADVASAVRSVKAGQIEYRLERESSIVHLPIGRASFGEDRLRENIAAVMDTLIKARPAASKGRYLRSIAISSTMGVGVKLDTSQFA